MSETRAETQPSNNPDSVPPASEKRTQDKNKEIIQGIATETIEAQNLAQLNLTEKSDLEEFRRIELKQYIETVEDADIAEHIANAIYKHPSVQKMQKAAKMA